MILNICRLKILFNFFIKIFEEGKFSYFIDGCGIIGGWMFFVNCVRYV